MNQFLLSLLCSLLYIAAVSGVRVSLNGTVVAKGVASFHKKHMIKVELVHVHSTYVSVCGETLADVDGSFNVKCIYVRPPLKFSLNIYHRLYDADKCSVTRVPHVEPSETTFFKISKNDSVGLELWRCPEEIYD